MKLTKKITAAVAALSMATTAFASTAMSASATTFTDYNNNLKNGSFYAYWDSDGDGDSEWAAAPYGMDDGNILAVTDNGDGTYELELQDATFTLPVIGSKTGYISSLCDSGSNETLTGTNVSGHPAYAVDIVATDVSSWTSSDFEDATKGTQYTMTAKVKMGLFSWEVKHERQVIFVVE